MASTVKCNTCNIVIDELLAYVQNKISVIDEDTLIMICVSSFKSEEIKRSKSLLYDSLPTDKRKILRKKQGKEGRDVEDIVSLLKGSDPEIIPVFVAKDLEKLPPVLFDHLDVTQLLKDLLLLQNELKDIKTRYVTSEQLEELKMDIKKMKMMTTVDQSTPNMYRCIQNVNTHRGAYRDSGPIGLSNFDLTLAEKTSLESNSPYHNEIEGRIQQDHSVVSCQQQTSGAPVIETVRTRAHESLKEQETAMEAAESASRQTGLASETTTHQLLNTAIHSAANNNNTPADNKRSYADTMKTGRMEESNPKKT